MNVASDRKSSKSAIKVDSLLIASVSTSWPRAPYVSAALSVTGFIRQTFKDLLRLRLRKQCNAIVRLLAVHFSVISQFGNIIKGEVFIADFTLLDAYDVGVQTVNNGFELMQTHSNAVGVK